MNHIYFYVTSGEVLTTIESLLFYYEVLNCEDSIDRDVFPIESSVIEFMLNKINSIIFKNKKKTVITIIIIDKFNADNIASNLAISIEEYIQKIENCFESLVDDTISVRAIYDPIYSQDKKDILNMFMSVLSYNLISCIESLDKDYNIYSICLLNQQYLSDLCYTISKDTPLTKKDLLDSIEYDSFVENHTMSIYYSHTCIPMLL